MGVIEEALALGLEAHVLGGANGVYPPLEVAAAWAQRKTWRHIQAHMLLLLVESLAASGQPESADRLLKTELPRVLSRRTMQRGRLLAKFRYLTALVAYQMNRPQEAADALQEADQLLSPEAVAALAAPFDGARLDRPSLRN